MIPSLTECIKLLDDISEEVVHDNITSIVFLMQEGFDKDELLNMSDEDLQALRYLFISRPYSVTLHAIK